MRGEGVDGGGRIMSAKVYGDIVWDIAAENGLYAQSFEMDFGVSELWVPGADGDDEAGALFNETASWSLGGFVKTTGDAMTTLLGAAITIANLFEASDFVDGYSSGGLTALTGAKPARKKRDAKALDLNGVFKPFMGAVQ